jgi:hypothetical protein
MKPHLGLEVERWGRSRLHPLHIHLEYLKRSLHAALDREELKLFKYCLQVKQGQVEHAPGLGECSALKTRLHISHTRQKLIEFLW